MPEPAIHFSVPFALLAFLGFGPNFCFIASAVALLPDLDVLFRRHGSATHSLLTYVLILALAFLLPAQATRASDCLTAIWIALSSHVLIDLFDKYCLALWPAVKDELSISMELDVRFDSPFRISPRFGIKRRRYVPPHFGELEGRLATGLGVLISVLLVLLSLMHVTRLF